MEREKMEKRKIEFILGYMDDVVESVECFCSEIYRGLIKPLAIILIELFIAMTYPVWIIPYKIFRKTGKNQKSAEAYASKGEEEC